MAVVVLVDPLGEGRTLLKHCHYLRDWSALYTPAYVPFPPLDLMYAAAYLRAHGHTAHIIESSIKHLTHDKTVKIIRGINPDFVAIPTSYVGFLDDKYFARLIRSQVPQARIIFMGPLVTHSPAQALSDGSADFVTLGEPELALRGIAEGDLTRNVAYKKGDSIVSGQRTLLDLAELPLPARDLVDNQAYRYAIFNRKNPVTAMTISRGCPYSKCKFCFVNLYSMEQIRYRELEAIKAEIQEIVYKYKISEIFFRDQNFTSNRELVMSICEYIISNNIPILWRASTRVDLVDPELLQTMRRAGCYQISMGFESASQAALDANNKGITLEQSRQAARWAKEAGLEILGFFMVGMMGESVETLGDTPRFARELGVDFVQFTMADLIPGSPVDGELAEQVKAFPTRLLNAHVRNAYLGFYLRPGYIWKHIKRIDSWERLNLTARFSLNALAFFLLTKKTCMD